jgi:tetratricopeptide (TPR) repeat protein
MLFKWQFIVRRCSERSLACSAMTLVLIATLASAPPLVTADEPQGPAAAAKTPAADRGDDFDDPAEPFVPLRPRSGAKDDHVQAQALFAAARVAEQKQDYPRALRMFQRAWRLDGDATLALREIVPLAFNLERQSEAVRYAMILAERDPTDAVMLRRLALYQTEEGDLDRALRLFEKALALETVNKAPSSTLPLRMEMGRLWFVQKNYEAAARLFAEIAKALDDPKQSGIDEATQKALLGKPHTTYQLFGECFLEANRPDEALAAFEKAQKAKADDALYGYNLARVAAKKKDFAQALARLQPFFDKHTSNQGTEPYTLLGELLAGLGQ